MKKLKEYWAILLIIILIGGFFFYWYEIRPAHFAELCSQEKERHETFSKCMVKHGY
jgi:uncharacterized membrane protein